MNARPGDVAIRDIAPAPVRFMTSLPTSVALPSGPVAPPSVDELPCEPVAVDGRPIEEADIRAEMQHHPAVSAAEARRTAVRALIVRRLLLDEAARLGIDPAAEATGDTRVGARTAAETPEDAAVRRLLGREVSVPRASEAECRRYVAANPARFMTPTLFEGRHILLAVREDDAAGREAARERALGIIAQLADDPSRFAALARDCSDCPSAKTGGHLGQLQPGSTVPEFERAIRTLEPAAPPEAPIETRYGVHVVVVDRRVAGEPLPFEAVHARVAAWLEAGSFSRAVAQYIGILAGRARIEGAELRGSDGPLVQ